MKSNHTVLMTNEVQTYGTPVFAPTYSTTVSAAKMCTTSIDHYMHIRFL
jgi:hypothetical protein